MKLIILFFIQMASGQETSPLVLYPGQSEQIPVPTRASIHVEKAGILQIQDKITHLRIIAKKTGQTQIRVGKKQYQVHVLKQRAYKTYQGLSAWGRHKIGPTLYLEEGKIYVRGSIHTFNDWLELSNWTNSEDDFILQAQLSPSLEKQVSQHLQQLSHDNNIPYGVFHLKPQWELSLHQKEKAQLPQYRKIFSPLGVKITPSHHALASLPMIEVNILAAEVRRGTMSQLGMEWPQSVPIQVLPKIGADPAGTFLNVHLFEQEGLGKILASPTLLAQSGEIATFHSGGEFPIKTSNQFNANVIWKQYGIMLKIKPQADYTGKMSINIECEVSVLDEASAVDGVPGILINRISSHFNLKETKTIALSGLIKEEWGKSQQGLPGLRKIPLFSKLFSSESYRHQQSELVFFVTPRILK